MVQTAAHAHVIAERYLTSPAALAARPFGPVDALDTHSGRGAQVRIVFVDGGWDESELAGAVTRWCAIGCSEVCGVLDFGRHDGRWYLVLPPTLGLPVERWRTLRRPAAGDAVRLVLAFGRVAERVAAAGFSPDAAALADVAVGPGPTPFLERPLLSEAARPAPGGDGQRLLAAVCDAAFGPADPPGALAAWRDRARDGGFPGLGECLDELERCGAAAAGDEAGDAAGLDRLFDPGFDLDGPGVLGPPPRGRRLAAWIPALLIGLVAATFALGHLRPAGHAAAPAHTPASSPVPVVRPVAPTASARQAGDRHGARTHAARRPRHHVRRRRRAAARTHAAATTAAAVPPASTSTTTPAATTATTPATTTLPAPGGTTLPAP
jgi:hypothetical protein